MPRPQAYMNGTEGTNIMQRDVPVNTRQFQFYIFNGGVFK